MLHDGRPEFQDGVEDRHVLGAVGERYGDAIAGANTEGFEARRGGAHVGIEFAVGHLVAKEPRGGPFAELFHGFSIGVQERFGAVIQIGLSPLRVILEPGFRLKGGGCLGRGFGHVRELLRWSNLLCLEQYNQSVTEVSQNLAKLLNVTKSFRDKSITPAMCVYHAGIAPGLWSATSRP